MEQKPNVILEDETVIIAFKHKGKMYGGAITLDVQKIDSVLEEFRDLAKAFEFNLKKIVLGQYTDIKWKDEIDAVQKEEIVRPEHVTSLKLSKGHRKELESVIDHIPSNCTWGIINDPDIVKYFEWSERGLHKAEAGTDPLISGDWSGFNALCWGKKWRERMFAIKREQENLY